jgi:M6 family metalloprotease-like protein
MAILKQKENDFSLYMGWYGKCGETDCNQEYDLKSETKINTVYSTSSEGRYLMYSFISPFNEFTQLECGNCYWIILNRGNGEVDIPDFTVVDETQKNSQFKTLTTLCDTGLNDNNPVTPTPVSATPTPTPFDFSTPTPTPQKNVRTLKLPVVLLGWSNGTEDQSVYFRKNKLKWSHSSSSPERYLNIQDIEDMLNSKNYNHPLAVDSSKPTGSVNDYYEAISFGQLNIEFKLVPAGKNPNPKSNNPDDYAYIIEDDYTRYGGWGVRKKELTEALPNILKQVHENYRKLGKQFDDTTGVNGDFDTKTQILFIQAGIGAEKGGKECKYVHSHKDKFKYTHFDESVTLTRTYTIQPMLYPYTDVNEKRCLEKLKFCSISTIGVYAHEAGHAFNFSDVYDKDRSSYGAAGLLMGLGNYGNADTDRKSYLPAFASSPFRYNMAVTKKLFSIDVMEITETTKDIEIYPAPDVNKLYKIKHPEVSSDCWWVEYRTSEASGYNINYDKDLTGNGGLSILHETQDASATFNNILTAMKFETPKNSRGESGFYISSEQADGKFDLERKGNYTFSSHLYREGDEFSPFTLPSSISRTGIPSGIKIHNIRKQNNGSMLFDVDFITEPDAKIVSVDYSWGKRNNNHDFSSLSKSNLNQTYTITIHTENIQNGTTINLQINKGHNPSIVSSAQVNNGSCTMSINPSHFVGRHKISFSNIQFGKNNYFTYSIDNDSLSIFSWNDVVMGYQQGS